MENAWKHVLKAVIDGKIDEWKKGIVQEHDIKVNGNVMGAHYEIDHVCVVEWI